jgi:hemerythrin-like domain-containing protein
MEALVATMRDTRDPQARRDALAHFGTWLREHIRWEEDVLFEETQQVLDAVELKALGEDIRERVPAVPLPPPNSLA